MRLIDADEVIKELNDKIARLDAKQQIYMNNGLTSIADSMARKIELCIECRELLEHQPTAYDVDKVIEQLEKNSNPSIREDEHIIPESNIHETCEIEMVALSNTIEIVKGGGIDGNTNT
jgi:hypothetical protein